MLRLCTLIFQYDIQGRNQGENLLRPLQWWAESAPLVEIGLRYMKILMQPQSNQSPLWIHPCLKKKFEKELNFYMFEWIHSEKDEWVSLL